MTQPNPHADEVRRARADAAIARANAEASYFRLAESTISRTYAATYAGAVPTRLDTPWPSGDLYVGENRIPEDADLATLRDRANFLEADNWLADGVLTRAVENVVGATIRVEPRTPDKGFNQAVRRAWKRWANTTACDVRGEYTFGGLLRLVQRAKLRDGDIAVLLTYTLDDRGRRLPRLQVIEPHRIESPRGMVMGRLPNGNAVVDGVELNASGRAVAYHVRYTDAARMVRHQRVEARDMIFVKRSTRYGTVRGESAFRGGFRLFDQIMGYLDSVVVAARVGASQAMIQKRRSPQQVLGAMRQVAALNADAGRVEAQRLHAIQPGMVNVLNTDEDIVAFNPTQPQQQFPAALDAFCRILGTKFGLTLEQVLLNFSLTTYSSGKMAQNQARVTAGIEQEDLAALVVTRVYQWFVSLAIDNGDVKVPAGVDEPWAHEWIPTARISPEPLRDMQARELALKLGIDTRSNMAMEDGYDFAELCEGNAADRETLESFGLAEPAEEQPQQQSGPTEDEKSADFRRDVVTSLLAVPAAREAVYNLTDVPVLLGTTGVPVKPGYRPPMIPVVASSGPLVSGAVIRDPSGNVVGGDVENDLEMDAPANGGGTRNGDTGSPAGETPAQPDGGERADKGPGEGQ